MALFTTIFSLLLGEMVVRIFDLGPQIAAVRHENYQFSNNPLIQYELTPGSEEGGEAINSDGMRDREFAIPKPKDTFRIACIGDSITYGFEIARKDSYPKQLERLLNTYCADSNQPFEVLNFGVPGYNLKQIVENVKVKVLKYQPDLIIYGYCLNDPQDCSLEFLKLLASLTAAQKKYRFAEKAEGFWISHSRLARLAVYMSQRSTAEGKATGGRVFATADPENVALRNSTDGEYFTALHAGGEGRQNLESSLEILASAITEEEIPLLLVIFPVTNKLNPYPLGDSHRWVTELATAQHFYVYDLLEDYRAYQRQENKGVYFDYLHPDTPGSHYTAMIILSSLLQDSLLPGVNQQHIRQQLLTGTEEDQMWGRLSNLLPLP